MVVSWFQSKYAANKDKLEIDRIRSIHGDNAKRVIRDRVNSSVLTQRDIMHWKRNARKL
jgi:hypothetical protein